MGGRFVPLFKDYKMTVKELIQILNTLHPDSVIVTPGSDHSFNRVCTIDEEMASLEGGDLFEYYGEEHQSKDATKYMVVIFGD